MKKVIMGFIAAALIMPGAFAGSIDYLSNQSADYLRTYSRNASTDTDAAFYNPAGTAFMKDGLSLQLNNQTIFKTYSDTFVASGKEYKTTEPTPLLPSLWATYKKENMAGFIGFSAIGGGGQVQYKDGVPMMVLNALAVEAGIEGKLHMAGYSTADADVKYSDGSLYVNQYYPSMTIGGSYAINNMVSVSLGARAVYMMRSYTGEATYSVAGVSAYGITGAKLEVDAEETAFGVGGIVGLNLRPVENLNIGMRVESPVRLNAETKVHDGKGFGTLFRDGKHRRKDLPATIAAGLSYALGGLTVTTSADVFLIGLSDQGKDSSDPVYNNGYDDDYDSFGYEVSASAEYAIIPDFIRVSAGYMFNKVGGHSTTYGDLDFSLDSQSVGLGTKVNFSENIAGTLSLARIMYIDGKNNDPAAYKVKYEKDAYVVALGLDYRFN